MAEAFVELGAEGINKLTDKYYDNVYDYATKKKPGERVTEIKERIRPHKSNNSNYKTNAGRGEERKQRNRLPSPEGDVGERDRDFYSDRRSRRRDSSLERESLTSAQVIDDYESERTDPVRKPESVLSKRDLNKIRRDSKVGSSRMSYANGYAADRPRSQQPPRSRYGGYDDDDSDYDERTGRRYGATGRGYDDRDDRDYDREIIETERYQGPARNNSYRTSRSYGNDQYGAGAGAVTQYNRRSGEVADYESRRSGRSRSRGTRRGRDRSYSDSRSRSRSRSRSKEGIQGKIEEHFDTSMRGLGVGLAGAVAGGLAGRQFGNKHRERDIIIGAIVGGLGANAAETKWRDYKGEKERKDDDRYDQRYSSRDIGRSRSAMR